MGRTVVLQPLEARRHAEPLFEAYRDAADSLWTYLAFGPCADADELGDAITALADSPVRQAFAVVVEGRPVGLLAYRRVEWKCDDLNAPSRAAALRYGFRYEGWHRATSMPTVANAPRWSSVAQPDEAATPSDLTVTPNYGEAMDKPVVTVPDGDPPTELQITDHEVGTGPEAAAGSRVSVHYVGVAWSTGEQFDASWDRGAPLDFGLGAGQVIEGWDQGVQGMKVGGRRTLVIPPDMAYGSRGAPGAIAPNETLIFTVDLVDAR